MQQTGETRDAIIEKDNERLSQILEANAHRKEPYWIVIFAKPSKHTLEGKPILNKFMKPYPIRPPSSVGGIIGEVNNKTGAIKWEINMPQVPFDFDGLPGVQNDGETIVETSTIPFAYVTK